MSLKHKSSEIFDLVDLVEFSFAFNHRMKSNTGVTIILGQGSVYSKSGKQHLVTKSPTAAKFMRVSDMISKLIWSFIVLKALGIDNKAARLLQRNQITIALMDTGISNSTRTSHINIQKHYVYDRIRSGEITVDHCGTNSLVAYILTKLLQGSKYSKCQDKLMCI